MFIRQTLCDLGFLLIFRLHDTTILHRVTESPNALHRSNDSILFRPCPLPDSS